MIATSLLSTAVAAAGLAASPAAAADVVTQRIGGVDRYDTSVRLTQDAFPRGAKTVFIASGEEFADAISAGTAAAQIGSPVLLTRSGALPSGVRAEIKRLNPDSIVIVGGTARISAAVETALQDQASSVSRIAGADRYLTAAAVSKKYFKKTPTSHTFVASGENFADALSASSASKRLGAPVLLTKPTSLPAATAAELERLDAERLFVVGSTQAINGATYKAIQEYISFRTYRLNGANRYETSAAVSQASFNSADTVYLATGANFADALSAVPAAGGRGPVLLVGKSNLTTQVCQEVYRLKPKRIVTIGGTAAIEDTVADFIATKCVNGEAEPAPTTAPTTTPKPTPTSPSVPVASGDTPPDTEITCSMFPTQPQAQQYYDYWVRKGFGDHFRLDPDGDGTACEDRPRA
ncbi:MAG: cell wall-binding repeat-containing protein [Propioniciclava sp.]